MRFIAMLRGALQPPTLESSILDPTPKPGRVLQSWPESTTINAKASELHVFVFFPSFFKLAILSAIFPDQSLASRNPGLGSIWDQQ